MIHFAYDGSLNGDWVAHYAARFALATPARHLRLLHVRDDTVASTLDERLARIDEECAQLGVTLERDILAGDDGDVSERLLARLPDDPRALLVAGTRWRPRNQSYLAHSVTARLLARARGTVVGLRVVNPGFLGQPGTMLLPLVAATPRIGAALPLLQVIAPDLRELQLLLVHPLSRLRLQMLGAGAASRLLAEDRLLAADLEEELRTALASPDFHLDATAVLCDDQAAEILAVARRLHSRLIAVQAGHGAEPLGNAHMIERLLANPPCDVAVFGTRA
jgi:hypothetical protein